MTVSTDPKLSEREQFDTYTAVVEALTPYIEGAAAGDAKRIRGAFADEATMAGTVGGHFSHVSVDAFLELPTAPSPELRAHIAWIDVSGPAAAAKVEFIDWMGMRYTDYLLLVRKDGVWNISGKVFDAHSGGLAKD